VITALGLPDAVFAALASGAGGPAVIRHLQEAQRNKHLMLLRALAGAAGGAAPGSASFHAGYELLTDVQEADPGAEAWLLSLPHFGGWAHDCLIHREYGTQADLAYFACAAAAAAVRAGVPFEVDVPVRDGRVALPGLGSWHVADEPRWIRLRSDGEYVMVGGHLKAAARALVPDDGSAGPAEHWRGTPAIRAVTDGLAWDVLLETADPYLDRYTCPMATGMPPDEVDRWRRRIRSAWEVLVRHHRSVAESIRDGLSVIVPLTAARGTDLVSATTPAAFGAIAMSWQPDPVTMAETFVHEFQHVKLCGLMDMIPLVSPGGPKVYAPWRQDPRPVGGLLQGLYAHLGIARFWDVQRHAETDPDDLLRAQTAFARWRSTIGTTARTLLQPGCLTQAGKRFVRVLEDQGKSLGAEHLPEVPLRIAEAVALDHWLTWQVRHMATDTEAVAGLAAAYRLGEPFRDPASGARIEEDTRKVGSDVRTRLLNLRYLEPARYRELLASRIPELSEADHLLFSGEPDKAVRAYRDQIAGSAGPLPDAWIGLALAVHQLGQSPLQAAFATRLALILDVHTHLDDRTDALELAGWFG
jgi:HEXXH motif-containing protein